MSITNSSNLPSCLKEEYLSLVASWLLEEWYATEDDLVRETDSAYTRGTTRFGRQKQRISNEHVSGRYPWLGIENNGLDLVFTIVHVPCRFSNDNPDAPKKRAVLEVHQLQLRLVEDAEPGEAARFVFVIDQGIDGTAEPRVLLLGFSASGDEVCRWSSDVSVRAIGEATPSTPAPVEVKKPIVTPKRRDLDDIEFAEGS